MGTVKTRYCRFEKLHATFKFESPYEVRDPWGVRWDADGFRLNSGSGKSVYISYMDRGLPLFQARKIIKFIPDGDCTEKNCGVMRISVNGKSYDIGTWEIKDEGI